MSTEVQKPYRSLKRIKSDKFSIDDLHDYSLSLVIGTRDFLVSVVNRETSELLFIEEFKLENIKTIKTRILAIKGILESHHFLRAGFWKSITVAIKSHKFTLVPEEHFVSTAVKDYLAVSSPLKNTLDDVMYYHHQESEIVNVFSADKVLKDWLVKVYPKKEVSFIHQGSAIIEGILQYKGLTNSNTIFAFFDRGVLHIMVTSKKKLIYYNQFAVRKPDDYVRYVLMVYKELGLSPKSINFIMWGNISKKSQQFPLLKKHIKNIHFGGRNHELKYSYHFDELADHQHFDLLNVHNCE